MNHTFRYLLAILALTATVCGATTLQVKRGDDANLPSTLKMGEPAMTRDTHRVFFGYSTGKIELQPILGNYSCAGAAYMKKYEAASGQWVCTTPEGSGGGGSGTVESGTTGQLARYAADGTTVSGYTLPSYQSALAGVGTVELNGTDTGNRTTIIDWHSSDSVDFNTRMTRASGLNGQFTINNRGVSGTETGNINLDAGLVISTGNIGTTASVGAGTTSPSARIHATIGGGATPTEVARFETTGNAGATRGPRLNFYGQNGGTSQQVAAIDGLSPSAGNGTLVFSTVDSSTLTEHLRVSSAGVAATGALSSTTTVTGTQLISTVATGTAPLTVASTTEVANLKSADSGKLNGQAASYYATAASVPSVVTAVYAGFDASNITAGTNALINSFTVTGAAVGDFVQVSCSGTDISNNIILTGYVSSSNTVDVKGYRLAGSDYDPASATYYIRVIAHP